MNKSQIEFNKGVLYSSYYILTSFDDSEGAKSLLKSAGISKEIAVKSCVDELDFRELLNAGCFNW